MCQTHQIKSISHREVEKTRKIDYIYDLCTDTPKRIQHACLTHMSCVLPRICHMSACRVHIGVTVSVQHSLWSLIPPPLPKRKGKGESKIWKLSLGFHFSPSRVSVPAYLHLSYWFDILELENKKKYSSRIGVISNSIKRKTFLICLFMCACYTSSETP